ncbi:hypothetical protein F5884DRAFT_527661 [Xylogone sp. PMI_703]|nr:hypothetical protein F5884DRAFT_527661 [Xylogone sp. PMI_703]
MERLLIVEGLTLSTMRSCDKLQARLCFGPGVYIHVIYDPVAGNSAGVYVGSSIRISSRIKEHIEDFKAAKKYKRGDKKLERKKRRLNTVHLNFWRRRGFHNFWVVFGQLKMQEGDTKEELALLLNILKMYAMFLFRTLPPQTLQRYLPTGFISNKSP